MTTDRKTGPVSPMNVWGEVFFPGQRCDVLCADGKIRRATIVNRADTFFSVPARVRANGKTVTGYISVLSRDGYDTVTADDPAVYHFTAYLYGKNHNAIRTV